MGKSVIFNQLTGANQKVANFPGITLHYLRGKTTINRREYTVVDLPGIYGFATNKLEENVTHRYLIENSPSLIINVIDSRKLERNLALTLQLIELQIPMILVLTFGDRLRGKIDLEMLEEQLKLPVFLINSHDKKEIQYLKQQIYAGGRVCDATTDLGRMDPLILELEQRLKPPIVLEGPDLLIKFPLRWMIIHSLLIGTQQMLVLPSWINGQVTEELARIDHLGEVSTYQITLIQQYYDRAEDLAMQVLGEEFSDQSETLLNKLDSILLDPVWGLLAFVLIMFLMFTTTFVVSIPITDFLESVLSSLSARVVSTMDNELLASFLADGVIGGIGFVLVFIPQIAILFLFIGVIEYTGYMARVVFITDHYLRKLNISGTSVAPLLLGFGCNVPGILATRSIIDPNERTIISLVNPFMTCSARLPVFIIIASALFPSYAGLVVTILYFTGILIALSLMYIFRSTILKGESTYLIMELPELEIPSIESILLQVYRHIREFISNAASWMSLGIMIIWLLSITGPSGYLGPEGLQSQIVMEKSWVYAIGSLLSPFFEPMGWDVRLIVALILGFIAKEIVVGSLGLLYGIESSGALEGVLVAEFTAVSAFAFMIFVLVYTPCIGAYFTLRQRVGKKWANFSIVLGLLLGYLLALVISVVGNTVL